MIEKGMKEVWIVFIRSVDVSHSQTLAISNDITYYKASIRIRENLVNLKIIIIEKNTNPCFAAATAAEKRFVTPFTSPCLRSAFRTMDLLQHIYRLLFRSQPVKHLFSFGIVSQSPDIEGNYFQICCIMSNEGG